ncbi:nucleotidyltransferase family protein [Ekhidna sp.]|uniref:nucleotidyltransferase family protein n=1 Tax=Ekhidna sp. TaxID=2608089 RepID=UPI003B5B0492
MSRDVKIGAAILAAGSSSRLGVPKQLVSFKGKSLLQHMIDVVESVDLSDRMVLLGANEKDIREQIDFKSTQVILNEQWEKGMAGSLRMAVESAIDEKLDALLILLSDQPFVNRELLNQLIEGFVPDEEMIVASSYGDVLGVPALFDKYYFRELSELEGDAGARKLINTYRTKVKGVRFEDGLIDIDTPKDLNQLN